MTRFLPRRMPGLAGAVAAALMLSWTLPAAVLPAAAQSISALANRSAASRSAGEPAASPASAIAVPPAEAGIPIPVPAVTLYPGDIITAAMLGARHVPATLLDQGGLAGREGDLIGKAVRRALAVGQPIPLNAVADAPLVTKGATARVFMNEGGLTISGYATALETGTLGALVRLKNMDSGQIIVGRVEADGSVRVKMQ